MNALLGHRAAPDAGHALVERPRESAPAAPVTRLTRPLLETNGRFLQWTR